MVLDWPIWRTAVQRISFKAGEESRWLCSLPGRILPAEFVDVVEVDGQHGGASRDRQRRQFTRQLQQPESRRDGVPQR